MAIAPGMSGDFTCASEHVPIGKINLPLELPVGKLQIQTLALKVKQNLRRDLWTGNGFWVPSSVSLVGAESGHVQRFEGLGPEGDGGGGCERWHTLLGQYAGKNQNKDLDTGKRDRDRAAFVKCKTGDAALTGGERRRSNCKTIAVVTAAKQNTGPRPL